MSKVVKCDFCKKILKRITPYYRFEVTYRDYTEIKYIDVCKSCYKKFIRSVQVADALEEVEENNERTSES